MDGLLHLLDLVGRTIAQLQDENARLKEKVEALMAQVSATASQGTTSP